MIKIKGHSNFKVKCIIINNQHYILKSTDKSNENRLDKQIDKQIYLYNNNFLNNCYIPKIFKKEYYHDNTVYYMEYIKNSVNIIDFLLKENTIKVDWLYNNIINIIDSYITKCKIYKIQYNILQNKINNILHNILNNNFCKLNIHKLIKYFIYIKNNSKKIANIPIPINICHGDMTFSNILIDTNNMKIYLIDFLDSFIETPLFDIIKIRQDTSFNWTLNMYEYPCDKNKLIITMKYLDKKFHNYFNKYSWYKLSYKYYQILNILRILQYSKSNKITNILINYLNILY